PHAGGGIAASTTATAAAAAALVRAVVHGERYVSAHDHLVAIVAVELDEDVLPGDRVVAGRRNHCIGNAVEACDGNEFGLGVERVVDMHVRHDLFGAFDEVVAHLVGGDLGEPEVRLGIDETG